MANGLFDLTGKVTLVTGGNSGIGLGFARGVAKQGSDVVIWARSAEKNAAAKKELEAFGVRVVTREVDTASEAGIKEGYQHLVADFGHVDCVFANAGRSSRSQTILGLEAAEWHDLLAVNLHGAFFTLREAARLMAVRAASGGPGGSLVFCGSLSIYQGVTGIANYAASKGGMDAVIRTMAVELGQYGIRCNTIAPGYIKTGVTSEALPPELAQQLDAHFAAKTPIHRAGTPADFEGIAAYLCSDASSFHTGDTIVIDGGSLVYPAYAF